MCTSMMNKHNNILIKDYEFIKNNNNNNNKMEIDKDISLTSPYSPSPVSEGSIDDEISIHSNSSNSISSPTRNDTSSIHISSHKYNIYNTKFLSENQELIDKSSMVKNGQIIPRTVPCIVLSKPNIFSPSLYTTSPLFPFLQPVPSNIQNCTKFEKYGEIDLKSDTTTTTTTTTLLKSVHKISTTDENAMNMIKSFHVDKILCDDDGEINLKIKNENSKKQLTFGIDRILSTENKNDLMETGVDVDDESLKNNNSSYSSQNSIVDDIDFSSTIKSSSSSSSITLLQSQQQQQQLQQQQQQQQHHQSIHQSQLHHQHQPGYSTHCSECILLSRYYYKIQLPIPRSLTTTTTNYSNYSWLNSQSIFENHNNGTNFAHHNNGATLSTSFGFNSANYASLVSCNNVNGNGRRKRSWSRAVFSNLQRKGLEKRFQIQKYITKPDRRDLAAALGLSDAQVKVWFQNRRMKWRHTKDSKSGGADEMTNFKINEKK